MASNVAKGSWTIIVCGDLPSPVPVYIPDPTQYTIAQLKEEIEKKTNVPVKAQILYYSDESSLPTDGNTPLISCQGLKNGVAISLTTTAKFVINVQRVDTGGKIKVELPLMESQDWSIEALRELICYKFGVPVYRPHVLAIEGEILLDEKPVDEPHKKMPVENPHILAIDDLDEQEVLEDFKPDTCGKRESAPKLTIGNYQQIKSDCLVTLTFLTEGAFAKPHCPNIRNPKWLYAETGKRTIMLPFGTKKSFANEKVCYHRDLQYFGDRFGSTCSECQMEHSSVFDCPYYKLPLGTFCNSKFKGVAWQEGWTIYIKMLNGTKVAIPLSRELKNSSISEIPNIPIFVLRELISEKTSVPTYQQRLLFGETILNDWNESGESISTCVQLLCSYHIHDGATLNLISLTKGIRLKLHVHVPFRNYTYDSSGSELHQPTYLNIPCPDQFTVQQLERQVRAITGMDVALYENGHTGGSSYNDCRCQHCTRSPYYTPSFMSGGYHPRGYHTPWSYQQQLHLPCQLGRRCQWDEPVSSLSWLCNDFEL